MRKVYLFIFVFILLALPVFVHAETINDFSAVITVNRDASLDVSERITYDFGTEERHGIYRDIPYKYAARGGNYNLGLSQITVTDGQGVPYQFQVSSLGDNKRIKIGDPNRTVSGVHIYLIKYRVEGAINYFADHDELYWNATGNGWTATIEQARADIILPQPVPEDRLNSDCYAGAAGSQAPCLSKRYEYAGGNTVTKAVFISDRLEAGQGLTVAVGWPPGLVTKPTLTDTIIKRVRDNGILFLPLAVLVLMFFLWYKRGRDPKGRGTIIAQFDAPDNLSPAEVGTIIDERADQRDISAEIIYLAIRGYLKIKRQEGKGIFKKDDYELTKLKEPDNTINTHQRKLLEAIFGNNSDIKLSDLKEKFYQDLQDIKKAVYSETVKKGYFPSSPKKVQGIYLALGIIVGAVGMFVGSALGAFGVIGFIASGAIIAIFGFFMPVRTKAGVAAREHILGLKEYLKVAEKDRIEFHNAPKKDPQIFEKLLPFAMVLGVEKQWAKQFEGIYNQAPGWYTDPSGGVFTALVLTNSLGSFQASANTTLASRPASSGGSGLGGGGFSGGGFGGGGGGSW